MPPPAAADVPPVILIAPNLSEQMGGEAIKSLQIARELLRRGVTVRQITHARVRDELSAKFPQLDVTYLPDTTLQSLMWKSVVFRRAIHLHFQWSAARAAAKLLRDTPGAVVHYTSPISPALPAFRTKGAPTVHGPLNGNIPYPPAFRHREGWADWIRRVSHGAAQRAHGLLFRGKQSADALLIAGGDRTARSMRLAGCRDTQFVDTLDSGVPDAFADHPAAVHAGRNVRFVHSGRLIDYKGADLAIRAVAAAKEPVELTIIGRGPDREKLERLAAELGVAARVTFVGWVEHAAVADTLCTFRALVFPSLAEANGIIVQEAMMLGLPVIAVDWGGPALLVTADTGVLVPPTDQAAVVAAVAAAMDRLAADGELAARLGAAGRRRALAGRYRWSDLIDQWVAVYRRVAGGRADRMVSVQAGV